MYKCWRICPLALIAFRRFGEEASELGFFKHFNLEPMTRKKVELSEKLIHKITIRVSTPFRRKMEGWLEKSNSRTLAELARLILYKEQIIWYHKDEANDALSVEMTAIRKELNAIGNNINQVTRYFNSTSIPSQKIFGALKVLDEYQKVKNVIERLSETINKLNHGRQSD